MIIGEQVRLRAIEREDLPRFVQWLNDPEVRDNLELYQPLSMPQEERWFEEILKRHTDEQPLCIEIQFGGSWQLIGNISFFNLDRREQSTEVGIFIGEKKFWGKGYGTDAMMLMINHGFMDLNLNRIFLRVFETNPRGIRSYEKAGFSHEGQMRQARYQKGRFVDVLFMSILKDEWTDTKKNGDSV